MIRQGFTVHFFATALLLPSIANAQNALPCLTPAEGQAVISFALPDMIESVAKKCAPVAGPSSYLGRSGNALASRFKQASQDSWPLARPVIRKLTRDNAGLFDLMPDETLRTIASTLAATWVVQQVDTRQCGDIDRILQAVAPLPPQNMSMLIGFLLEILSRPKAQAAVAKAKSPFNICPVPSGAGKSVTTK